MGWEVSKRTFRVAGTANVVPGVLSVTAEMELEADRAADVFKTAKAGVSICNIEDDVAILDLVVGKLLNVKPQPMLKIRNAVLDVECYAAMLGTTELRLKGFQLLKNLPDATLVVGSVLLSISNVLGREAAVEVTRSFIEKVAEVGKGEPTLARLRLDKERMRAILKSFLQNVVAGGTNWLTLRALGYDLRAGEGEEISASQVFKKVTFGMMASLIWWLYSGMKVAGEGEAQAEPQICKIYDSRMHKVVYLLEKFGWPVHAALRKTESDFKGVCRVIFLVPECTEGVEDMPLLLPDEVEKHGFGVPRSGSWMICKYKDIGKVLRARNGVGADLGCNLESGWEEGWKIGTSREVDLRDAQDVVLVDLGDPTVETGDAECLGCEGLLLGGGGGDIKAYAGRFHRMYGGSRKEYESQILPFMSKMVSDKPLQAALVGFGLGYLCGSIFSVARAMDLLVDKEDVCLSWLDDIDKFLYDLDDHMRMQGFKEGLNLGGCLNFVTGCFYGEAERIGWNTNAPVQNNCVGTLARDKVLLLEAVITPTLNLAGPNWRVVELDYLPINVPCRDGKYILSAKAGFNTAFTQATEITQNRTPQEGVVARPATTCVSFTIGPNLINNDGTVMHNIYARGRLLHCSSVLEAISVAKHCKLVTSCPHQGQETRVYKPHGDRLVYPVSDTDLIKHGVLISPLKDEDRMGTIVVQVDGDDLWRYTAASMYREHLPLIASDCLACAGNEQVEVIIV